MEVTDSLYLTQSQFKTLETLIQEAGIFNVMKELRRIWIGERLTFLQWQFHD